MAQIDLLKAYKSLAQQPPDPSGAPQTMPPTQTPAPQTSAPPSFAAPQQPSPEAFMRPSVPSMPSGLPTSHALAQAPPTSSLMTPFQTHSNFNNDDEQPSPVNPGAPQPTPPPPSTPPPATPPASTQPAANTGPQNGDFQGWIMGLLAGKPFNQQTLLDLEPLLQQFGSQLTPANTQGERTKIWDPFSKQWVRVGFGEGHPVWIPQGAGGGTGTQWNDPATQQLQSYVEQWMKQLQGQWGQWQSRIPDFQQRMGQSQASVENLVKYLQGRAQRLQGPAFTGPEMEVFRTQALDPIEADRGAAQQRAVERISRGGYLPTSGVAIDLQNQVDQPFDRARNTAQNELAYQTIAQKQSNEREAQGLLGMIPQLQSASMTGDFEFLQALDQAMNNPMQQGLPLSSLIYDLPNQAQQQALAVLNGTGYNPSSMFNSALGLANYQTGQQNRGIPWYQQLGSLLPFLLGGGGGGGR